MCLMTDLAMRVSSPASPTADTGGACGALCPRLQDRTSCEGGSILGLGGRVEPSHFISQEIKWSTMSPGARTLGYPQEGL